MTPNPWQLARQLHVAEQHEEQFMVDCDHWRCLMAYAWYWRQEKISQVENCQHEGRKRAMIRHLEINGL